MTAMMPAVMSPMVAVVPFIVIVMVIVIGYCSTDEASSNDTNGGGTWVN